MDKISQLSQKRLFRIIYYTHIIEKPSTAVYTIEGLKTIIKYLEKLSCYKSIS